MGCSVQTKTTVQVPAYVPPAPAPPSSVTVTNVRVLEPSVWTFDVNVTGSPGATNWKIFVDDQEIGTATSMPASAQSNTAANQQHTVGVSACNQEV